MPDSGDSDYVITTYVYGNVLEDSTQLSTILRSLSTALVASLPVVSRSQRLVIWRETEPSPGGVVLPNRWVLALETVQS